MTRFYKALYLILAVLLLSWALPWLNSLIIPQRGYTPFTLYSEVLQDFVSLDAGEGNEIKYYDRRGNYYTENQFDSLLPSFYYRQLAVDNRLPDSIMGRPITADLLREKGFMFRSRPMEINSNSVPLYPLLESKPRRVDLEMPDDLFRWTSHGIEFIDLSSNTIDEEKSALFQDALDNAKVHFPIKHIAGNPTNRKSYDEGYFFVDADDQLFHLKQVDAAPYVRRIDHPKGIVFEHIFVTEYDARETFAFLFDKEGYFYLLSAPDYGIIKTGLPPIDLKKDELTIFGNDFFWTTLRRDAKGTTYEALERKSMKSVATHTFPKKPELQEKVAQYSFPWQLSFTSNKHTYFRPSLKTFSFNALPLGFCLAVLYSALFYKREERQVLIIKSVLILLAGLFAFIPFLILPRIKKIPSGR